MMSEAQPANQRAAAIRLLDAHRDYRVAAQALATHLAGTRGDKGLLDLELSLITAKFAFTDACAHYRLQYLDRHGSDDILHAMIQAGLIRP